LTLAAILTAAPPNAYAWLSRYEPAHALARRITPPPGYERVLASKGSSAHWLRHLPLKPGRPPVLLYDRRKKPNQGAHVAVVKMDVGRRDLQQCADAVIRLRAEYLWTAGRKDEIHFNFTSGDRLWNASHDGSERAAGHAHHGHPPRQ
jgi:uncharacterized protein DUF4846